MQATQKNIGASQSENVRRMPAYVPNGRLSAGLGIISVGIRLAILAAVVLDADRTAHSRFVWMAALGGLLGLTYFSSATSTVGPLAGRSRLSIAVKVVSRAWHRHAGEKTDDYWAGYAQCARDILGERAPDGPRRRVHAVRHR